VQATTMEYDMHKICWDQTVTVHKVTKRHRPRSTLVDHTKLIR